MASAGTLAGWLKSISASGNTIATRIVLRTLGAEPSPGPGETKTHQQLVELVAADGSALEPSTDATALAPVTLGSTTWVKVLDAPYVGCELQNDSDTDLLVVRTATQPADGADVGIKLHSHATEFFAPPRAAGYVGPIWARAVSGSGKSLRRMAW